MTRYQYYIASGFFNEEQIATVSELENTFDKMKVERYSPREHGVIMKKDSPLRNVLINLILNSNVDAILGSDNMVANLQGNDLGTLWEVGFWLGRCGLEGLVVINDATNVVEEFIYKMNNTPAVSGDYPEILLIENEEDINVIFTEAVEFSKLAICTDDRPPLAYLALGFLTGRGQAIERRFTYSTQNHGSNIMIAGSIANHIRVDSVDNITPEMFEYKVNKSAFNEVIE